MINRDFILRSSLSYLIRGRYWDLFAQNTKIPAPQPVLIGCLSPPKKQGRYSLGEGHVLSMISNPSMSLKEQELSRRDAFWLPGSAPRILTIYDLHCDDCRTVTRCCV